MLALGLVAAPQTAIAMPSRALTVKVSATRRAAAVSLVKPQQTALRAPRVHLATPSAMEATSA